jgi:hypothetical protein
MVGRRFALPPCDPAPVFFVGERHAAVLGRRERDLRRRLAGPQCRPRRAAALAVCISEIKRPTDFNIAILMVLLLGDLGRSCARVRKRTDLASAGLALWGTAGSCNWAGGQ